MMVQGGKREVQVGQVLQEEQNVSFSPFPLGPLALVFPTLFRVSSPSPVSSLNFVFLVVVLGVLLKAEEVEVEEEEEEGVGGTVF